MLKHIDIKNNNGMLHENGSILWTENMLQKYATLIGLQCMKISQKFRKCQMPLELYYLECLY